MPRRGHNRVGVEVDLQDPRNDNQPHDESGSPVHGSSSPTGADSAQSMEDAKAQRQRELLRRKKAERRAHAKQRAEEKQRRLEEKQQEAEIQRMLEEDISAVASITPSIEQSSALTESVEKEKAFGTDTVVTTIGEDRSDVRREHTQEVENADAMLEESHYPATVEIVQKSPSQHPSQVDSAALTIQKALKKRYKKCKTMFRQSPRVHAEEMIAPLSTPAETTELIDLPTSASELTSGKSEVAPTNTATDEQVQLEKSQPMIPPLLLPQRTDGLLPRPNDSPTSASCSSSCSCESGVSVSSTSSCSCSCSCSSPSSNSSSESEIDTHRQSHRHSKRTARTSRTERGSVRSHRCSSRSAGSIDNFLGKSGPSSALLKMFRQEIEYGDLHHFMATRIQARVRGGNGRAIAHQRQAALDQELRDEALLELQHEACCKIQSRARGLLVRKSMPITDRERRRRRRKRAQLRGDFAGANSPRNTPHQEEIAACDDPEEVVEWPAQIDLEALDDWQELNENATALGDKVTHARFLSHGQLRVFCGTWNMHAKKPTDDLRLWIRLNKYHIVAIGSEECVNSIAKSVVFTSKKSWEDQLKSAMGDDYVLVTSHALTAIHNIVFVHASVLPLLGNIQSDAVATGLGNQLGNKGGVGIAFTVGATSFAFVNCHFEAHQRNVSRRNENFHRINHELKLSPTSIPASPRSVAPMPVDVANPSLTGLGRTTANRFSIPTIGGASAESKRTISERFDRVFWYGDLNYRISGTRRMVDLLLLRNQHAVLYANDQLRREMQAGHVFPHFQEGPLHFRPTYKFDKRSDVYDSSSKQRIPSWTDRVLYLSNEKTHDIEPLNYRSQTDFRSSDHRPVSAIFQVNFTPIRTGERLPSARSVSNMNASDNDQLARNRVASQACTLQ